MIPVAYQTATGTVLTIDPFSFMVLVVGVGLFLGIVVFLVLEFFGTRHRQDVEDKMIANESRMIDNSILLSQNQQQAYNNYMNWWMNFQNQQYTTEVGLRREAMEHDASFMNKLLGIFQMWAEANIMSNQELTSTLSRFMNTATISLIWQLAQNGMFIEDILQLIGINASTDQIAKLVQLLNSAGVDVKSRTVPPAVQVIENPPSTQSTVQQSK